MVRKITIFFDLYLFYEKIPATIIKIQNKMYVIECEKYIWLRVFEEKFTCV